MHSATRERRRVGIASALWLLALCCAPSQALAYVGPGGGLSIAGSVLALLIATVAAIFGFVWYPLKRLIRRMRGDGGPSPKDQAP